MAAILNSAILNSAILDSKPFSHYWFKNFTQTHSFWFNLMMAAILNSAILDSAILNKTLTQTNSIWLKLLHSHSTWWRQPSWIQPFAQKNFSHSFWLNLMMAAILNSANLNSTILDSAILVFPLKLTHTCQDWFPPFAQKIFNHSFWLNLMMAAILNSAMLNLDTWHLGFRHLVIFSQIHSKTLSLHSDSESN